MEAVLKRLDDELAKLGEKRSLIVMDIIDRRTRDIDVIAPGIDPVLKELAERVGNEFGLAENWLNDGPASLARELTKGWKARTAAIYEGKTLELRALGREDLLAIKLFAFCDREDDFDDVVKLKPSKDELDKAFPWVLKRDASPLWPKRVENCLERLRKRLGYE